MGLDAQPFAVTITGDSTRTTVAFSGELDLAGVDRAREAIAEAEERDGMVVLDLSELTFIDSTGLEVVLRAARRAQESGRRLVVARPSQYVRRLFELTAIDQSLDIVDGVV
jgi:anti-sigma B factor antagonist